VEPPRGQLLTVVIGSLTLIEKFQGFGCFHSAKVDDCPTTQRYLLGRLEQFKFVKRSCARLGLLRESCWNRSYPYGFAFMGTRKMLLWDTTGRVGRERLCCIRTRSIGNVLRLSMCAKRFIEQFIGLSLRTLCISHGLFDADDLMARRALAEAMTGAIHFVLWSKPTHVSQFWCFHAFSFPQAGLLFQSFGLQTPRLPIPIRVF